MCSLTFLGQECAPQALNVENKRRKFVCLGPARHPVWITERTELVKMWPIVSAVVEWRSYISLVVKLI